MPPAEVWNRYVKRQPANTSAIYSARLEVWFRSIAMILFVEQTDQGLSMAALSPAGIKIFDAGGGSNLIHKTVYIPQSKKRLEAFAITAWKDLKFLLEPPPLTLPAGWTNRRGRWIVEQPSGAHVRIRYEFDEFTGSLLQKERFENNRSRCQIRFFDKESQSVIEIAGGGYRLFLKPNRKMIGS